MDDIKRFRIWIDKNKYTGLYRCRVRDRALKINYPVGQYKTAQESYNAGNEFIKNIGD